MYMYVCMYVVCLYVCKYVGRYKFMSVLTAHMCVVFVICMCAFMSIFGHVRINV